jgi:hypothetical protein
MTAVGHFETKSRPLVPKAPYFTELARRAGGGRQDVSFCWTSELIRSGPGLSELSTPLLVFDCHHYFLIVVFQSNHVSILKS